MVSGELGPQAKSGRGEVGPQVNSVRAKSVRSRRLMTVTVPGAILTAFTAMPPVRV